MTEFLPGLAQAAPSQGLMGTLLSLAPILIVFGIFYVLVLMPERKKQQEKEKMIAALQKGDAVVLSSGIHGRIQEVQSAVLILEIADKVKIRVNRDAVSAVIRGEEPVKKDV